MEEISTWIDVAAPGMVVWAVLTDFGSYPEWNPFITRIEGVAAPGQRLRVRIAPPGSRAMTFRPRVLVADPGRELRWLGRLLVPGLCDGEHSITLTETGPAACRVTQAEAFRGALVPLLRRSLGRTTEGFRLMNEALRQRGEAAIGGSAGAGGAGGAQS
ncbi:MAG: SRPBCC family protein [Frankiaceae bacterium]